MPQETITLPAALLRELVEAADDVFAKHFMAMQQPYRRLQLANADVKDAIGMEQSL